MDDLDPDIEKACRLAVRSVLKNHPNASQVYYDTLQDAYLIALSRRGKKEAKTPQEFYWKVRYGLIDLFRERTHIRRFQRHGIPLPTVLSLDDENITTDFKDAVPSYRRWIIEERKRIAAEQIDEEIEKVLRSFSNRQKIWIKEWIQGKTLLTIAKENGLCESRISQVVSRFKKELRKSLSKK